MARGTRPTKQGAAVKGNVICVEVPLSIEPYGRIKILQYCLQGQLDKFSKSQSLQRHPASLRKSIESALIKPFQTPRLRFYTTGNEDVSYLKTFMAKNEIKWLDELQFRQCDGTEECGSGPVIHITLLEESDLLEATNDVIDYLGSKAGVGIAKDMLYVLNFEVNSRTQLQGHIERLLDRYPHICDKTESKGCRVFHTGDEMFTDRISVLLERYIEQSLKNIFRLCENLSSSAEESLKQTRLTEVSEILQSNIGHFASQPDEKTLKQASHNVAVRFKQFLRFHPGQEAEFFELYC